MQSLRIIILLSCCLHTGTYHHIICRQNVFDEPRRRFLFETYHDWEPTLWILIDGVNVLLQAILEIAIVVLDMSHCAAFSNLVTSKLQHNQQTLLELLIHFSDSLLSRS